MIMQADEITAHMIKHDHFSAWMGIRIIKATPGYCEAEMTITKTMLNGFGTAHGGITYSFADTCFAFAANTKGVFSVGLETSISHIVALNEGDEINAKGFCEAETAKLGHYKVTVTLKSNPETIIALFKGVVYKTAKIW
jgi:acyl-CoA thioesterase